MPEKYKQFKLSNGNYYTAANSWSCDICHKDLLSRGEYQSCEGICYECRKKVPDYIPKEQVKRWQKRKNVFPVE